MLDVLATSNVFTMYDNGQVEFISLNVLWLKKFPSPFNFGIRYLDSLVVAVREVRIFMTSLKASSNSYHH